MEFTRGSQRGSAPGSADRRDSGAGWRVGSWLTARPTARNAWAVSLLEVERDDRVLEIGFGPGVAIRELSRIAVDGHVCGIDHSAMMVRQAAKPNADDIPSGRVDLKLGRAEKLPAFEAPFDKVLAVNAMQPWDRPAERLAELRRALRAGGRIATALRDAGFCDVRLETLRLGPAVVCELGVNGPAPDVAQWSRAR